MLDARHPDHVEQLGHAPRDRGLVHPAMLAQRVADVAEPGERVEQRAALEDHRDLFADVGHRVLAEVVEAPAFDDHLAAVGPLEPVEMPQHDALALAAAAEHDEGLAFEYFEVDAPQHGFAGEALAELPHLDKSFSSLIQRQSCIRFRSIEKTWSKRNPKSAP